MASEGARKVRGRSREDQHLTDTPLPNPPPRHLQIHLHSIMKANRRQNPVSCQLCRSKKLKCDRQQPCSNCSARGVTCNFQQALLAQQGQQVAPDKEYGLVNEIPAILARLQRLEEAVASGRAQPLPPLASRPSADVAPRLDRGQQCSSVNVPLDYEAHWKEYQSFERTGMRNRSLVRASASTLRLAVLTLIKVFRTCRSLRVEAAEHSVTGPRVASFDHSTSSVLLPSQVDAAILLQSYFDLVNYHRHIIHSPTIRALVSTVYDSLPADEYHSPGRIALLLAIFASAAYFWRLSPVGHQLFLSSQEAIDSARIWGIAALDILELSRRVSTSSLEDVQATIIGASVFYHSEGYSSRTRFIQNNALSMARDLGLHRVDFPKRPHCDSAAEAVENEIKRRVWWHLAANDWWAMISHFLTCS